MDALTKAIAIVGGTAALARKLGVHSNAVTNWKKRGVPTDQCPEIERITNRLVRCEELNDKVDWAFIRNTEQV